MKAVILTISAVMIIFTLIPLSKYEIWWVRVFDFPQLQIAGMTLLCIIGYAYYFDRNKVIDYVIMGSLICAFTFLFYHIFPYTFLSDKQVKMAVNQVDDRSIGLFSANVYMENRNAQKCLDRISEFDPDVILLVETDQWWVDQMDVLKTDYPHFVEIPIDNTYGMALYSRLKLIDPKIKHLVENEIPSIHTKVKLRNGSVIKLHCLHPMPPTPTESESSLSRDKELLLIAKEADFMDMPTIVAGDLNDVAWSHTTRLFQRTSGLLDPRIGRGFFNTFSAKIPLLRWPLDHVFHTSDFLLNDIQRVPSIDSDHFPIYINLQHDKVAELQQEEPTKKEGDAKEVEEKLTKEE